MNINDILTPEFQDKVIQDFCETHKEIAEDEATRAACRLILEYVRER